MSFDKWFNKQDRLVQVILMVLPVVGWIVECLVRASILLRTKSALHLIVFLLFLFVGWSWIIVVIDLVYLILKGRLLFA
ncbi:MAG: hypothetical protein ACI4L9_01640 [Candidatus Coproplasma sp.]